MKQLLPRAWYGDARWLHWLKPLSRLYRVVAEKRRRAWQGAGRVPYRASVPVIVVGNLSAGGTGKTPLTLALCQHLQQQGWKPAIVSRGYGGKSPHYPLRVTRETAPEHSGDEALLLALNTDVPVVVDPDRSRAVRMLQAQLQPDVILCDDGLQHYALARDIEIVVVDGQRGFGNGLLLPAGPLRESPQRLLEVDYVIVNGEGNVTLPPGVTSIPMRIAAVSLVNIASGEILDCARWQARYGEGHDRVHAVAGIGNPARFFSTLSGEGFAIIAHPFPDHHRFRAHDINFADGRPVVMTEKDAVKCLTFVDARHWCLKVQAVLPAQFLQHIAARLTDLKNSPALQRSPQEPA